MSPKSGRAGGPTSSAMPTNPTCPRRNRPIPTSSPSFAGAYTHSACFAAGTLVQTIDGPRPIESIRVGDGSCRRARRPERSRFSRWSPSIATRLPPRLRIAIGGESIVATGIHRFWKAGKGWTMARELKPGDRLRMVGGTVQIESIEADKTQPVYNLDVAENRDFFVGTKGLLVHDFSFVQPVLEPFDRQSEITRGSRFRSKMIDDVRSGLLSFRIMPRTARVAPGGQVYHVLNRSVGKKRLFGNDADFLGVRAHHD